jgi:hypothetical protein
LIIDIDGHCHHRLRHRSDVSMASAIINHVVDPTSRSRWPLQSTNLPSIRRRDGLCHQRSRHRSGVESAIVIDRALSVESAILFLAVFLKNE